MSETKTWEADKAIRYSKAVNNVKECIGNWVTGEEDFKEQHKSEDDEEEEFEEEEEEGSETEESHKRKRSTTEADAKTPLTSKQYEELLLMCALSSKPEKKHVEWVKNAKLPFGVLGDGNNKKFLSFINQCGLKVTCMPVVMKLNCVFGADDGDFGCSSLVYPFRDEDIAYYCGETDSRPELEFNRQYSTPFFGDADQTWEENEVDADLMSDIDGTKKGVYIAHAAIVHEKPAAVVENKKKTKKN